MKKLSTEEIFQKDDITIECTNIRNYTFCRRIFKVILVEITTSNKNESLMFTVDIEIVNGSDIAVVSHHVNVSDGKSVPKLLMIDDPTFVLNLIKENLKEIRNDDISKKSKQ